MNDLVFLATTGHGLARATVRNDRWEIAHTLAGEDIACLAADPLQPGVVYAGTLGHGVLCSADYGGTWEPGGLAGQPVKAIAVSRAVPGTVYAGTRPARMYVSRDGGRTWLELPGFRQILSRRFWFSPAEKPFTAYVQAISLCPDDPQIMLAGIEFGAVVRSEDGGQTWSDHRRGALRDCHALAFHTRHGQWAYEGGGTGAGAAVSRDRGCSWQQPRRGLDRHYGWAVAADPADPEIWYVAASPSPQRAHTAGRAEAYIYRARGSAGWERLGGGLPQPLDHMPYALITNPDRPSHLYAGLGNGHIWFSTDHGESWERLPVSLEAIQRTMIMIPATAHR